MSTAGKRGKYIDNETQMHFRHLHGNHFDNLREGDIIRDPGFMSTTRDRDVMESLSEIALERVDI